MQNRKVFAALSCTNAERDVNNFIHSNNGKIMEFFQETSWRKNFSVLEGLALKKLFRMARFTIFCFFLGLVQSLAVETYAQQARLSLKLENEKLESALRAIEKESEFFFLYNKDLIDVDRIVNLDATNQTIKTILDKLLEGTDIKYAVVNRQIILSNLEGIYGLANQQQKSVSGKVTDSSGGSLPGVSVVIKGTTSGVISDISGNYSITSIPENAILIFSFIGMKTQEFKVGNQTTINVKFEDEAVGVDEVVVIGYGTQKKVNLTGSVSTIQGEMLSKRTVSQTSQAFQGLAPGLTVTQEWGNPGATASFNIRGIEIGRASCRERVSSPV